MALISVILTFLIDRYLGSLRDFRDYRWFERLTDHVREVIPELAKRPRLGVILLLLVPAVGAFLAQWILGGLWFGFAFAFGVAALLYAYDCQDLEPQIEAVIDARLRNDEEAVRFHLAATLRSTVIDDPRRLTRALIETVLMELNDRLLAVIFWFMLLGPAGALAFRFASLLKTRFQDDTSGFGAASAWVYHWLAWIPTRLTAFSYALAGSFVDAVHYRREEAHRWPDENRGVLVASGLGALQYPLNVDESVAPSREREVAELRAALELVRRTGMVWLGAVAIVTLLGMVVSLQLSRAL